MLYPAPERSSDVLQFQPMPLHRQNLLFQRHSRTCTTLQDDLFQAAILINEDKHIKRAKFQPTDNARDTSVKSVQRI